MSFTVRCPFCKTEMECSDDMLGQVGVCPACNREIDLDDGLPSESPAAPHISAVSAARAAALAAVPTTMPRVTFSWAFDFVLKITIAAALIDGFLGGMIWLFLFIYRSMTAPVHHYY